MKFIVENWFVIVAIAAVGGSIGYAIYSFMPEIHATLCVRHPAFVHLLPPLCG